MSVNINSRCADSVCLCSMEFVSDSKIKISVMIIFKNQHILIGKYIFVIFLSLFVKARFRGMGVGNGAKRPLAFWNLTFSCQMFCKNIVFLVWSGENVVLPLLHPPAIILLACPWKIHYWSLPGKNPSGRGRWGIVDSFLHFQPLLLYFNSIYTISCQNIKTTPLRKNFTTNLKMVLFVSSVPHTCGTLDMSVGCTRPVNKSWAACIA